jgi:general secretion pathway protein C
MRRLPLVASFLLFILLCASAAYWAMQLFKPPHRPVAAPPRTAQADARPEAAATLFGSRARSNVAAASNYQLRGVIFSGNPRDSVAIIGADGKPAQAVRVENEVVPGVTIKEVHRGYVLISEGGTTKRIELPEDAPSQSIATAPALPPIQRTPTPVPTMPPQTRAQTAAAGGTPMQIGPQAVQPQAPLPPSQPQQQAQQQQPQQQAQQPPAAPAPMTNSTTAPPVIGYNPAGTPPPPPMNTAPGANPTTQAQPGAQ